MVPAPYPSEINAALVINRVDPRRIDEFAVCVVADDKRVNAVAAVRESTNHELLADVDPYLRPRPAPSEGFVAIVEPLGNNALSANLSDALQELRQGAIQVLRQLCMVGALEGQSEKSFPIAQGVGLNILTCAHENVESEENDMRSRGGILIELSGAFHQQWLESISL